MCCKKRQDDDENDEKAKRDRRISITQQQLEQLRTWEIYGIAGQARRTLNSGKYFRTTLIN